MATKRTDLRGRTRIYTDVEEIKSDNVSQVLQDALEVHDKNASDIDYLYGYYKGDQAIASRQKTFNTSVLNKICVNRAKQITDFKTGYLLSAPIQYIDAAANDSEEEIENNDLDTINRWMKAENKQLLDMRTAIWQSICGTAFRMGDVREERPEDTMPPFVAYDLDPRNSFVVYSSRLGHKSMMGVTFVTDEDDKKTYYCYTFNQRFTIDSDYNIIETKSHILGQVPIIEYPLNDALLGDFEVVIPLLDAINSAESDRLDSIDTYVEAILITKGMEIEGDQTKFMQMLKELGGLQLPKDGDAFYLTLELNQQQTQTFVDALYDEIITICGLPNRHRESTSSSDTGSAIILRDGWSESEARAKATEAFFKASERRFLDLILLICNTVGGTDVLVTDVDIQFPRRNYTNDSANVTNLITMLSNDWVTPEFAYAHSNLTPDPHRDFLLAKKWHDEQESAQEQELASIAEPEDVSETGYVL